MTAQVSIVQDQARNVLLIPSPALGPRDREGRAEVQVQAPDGRIERRQVTVGLDNRSQVEVRDGLQEGERVVIGEAGLPGSGASAGRGRGPMGPGGGPPPPM